MRVLRTLAVALLVSSPLLADEGMWMPQQIPALGNELTKLGLQIDPKQFADLTGFPMGAIVSTGGCSASFVSPDGLVVTNHHCVFGALAYNATPENDILRHGFLARTRSAEIPAAPDARIYVTTGIEDVTDTILAPFPPGTTDAQRTRLIRRRQRGMIDACERPGNIRCTVASFFDGAQYLRLTQLEIRDVRLVYAPALGVGNFGGEVDNWMWPRHTGDFGFYRAYVGRDGAPADYSRANVPYHPKHFLKVSTRDLDQGDLVMVSGTPGATHRHVTPTEVVDALEFDLPTSVRYRKMLFDLLRQRSLTNPDVALKNASRMRGLANYMKKHTGTLAAFQRGRYVEVSTTAERDMRRALSPELLTPYETAYGELQKILEAKRTTRERDTLFAYLYTASPMLTQANRLYRLSIARTQDDLDRSEEYTERKRNRLQQTVTAARRSMEPVSDRAGLRLFILEAAKLPARERITPIDAALAATGKTKLEEQVDALLERVYRSTKIGGARAETKMFEETTAQLDARNDSMIAFAALLRPFGDQLEEEADSREGAESRVRPAMLAALRAANGGRLYPDANRTLRVGFGVVGGYSPRNGVSYPAQTDVAGVVAKSTGIDPFNTPPKLLEMAKRGDFGPYADPELHTLPVAFISTNVVTNGSSGSATLNAWGELCGLAFDSNWEGVGSDYVVENDMTRTIHVDSRYMLWVMDKVDGATNLLRELGF